MHHVEIILREGFPDFPTKAWMPTIAFCTAIMICVSSLLCKQLVRQDAVMITMTALINP